MARQRTNSQGTLNIGTRAQAHMEISPPEKVPVRASGRIFLRHQVASERTIIGEHVLHVVLPFLRCHFLPFALRRLHPCLSQMHRGVRIGPLDGRRYFSAAVGSGGQSVFSLRPLLPRGDRGNDAGVGSGAPDLRALRRALPGLWRGMQPPAGAVGLGGNRLPARDQRMLCRGGGFGALSMSFPIPFPVLSKALRSALPAGLFPITDRASNPMQAGAPTSYPQP